MAPKPQKKTTPQHKSEWYTSKSSRYGAKTNKKKFEKVLKKKFQKKIFFGGVKIFG